MLTVPPVAPATGWRASLRLPRDHYIRLDSNDYSIHPSVIGRRIEVIADLDRVRAVCEGKLVADHERIWAAHQAISDPEHIEAAKALRRTRISLLRSTAEPDVQIRCLDDYDTALGVTTGEGEVAS
jgi:transposase